MSNNNINNTLEIKKSGREIPVIDSREVAAMLGKDHKEVLQYIEGRVDKNGNSLLVGIVPTLESEGLHSQNYFIPSSYKTAGNNKTYKCYLVTKMGCEVLGNKQQGKKGILFTAKYVERFNKMEEALKNKNKIELPTDYLSALKALVVSEEERQRLLEINKEQAPKVEYFNKVLDSSKLITITEIANDLGISARELNKFLETEGIQNKQYKQWKISQEFLWLIEENYADYEIYSRNFGKKNQQLKWTEKGRNFIVDLVGSKLMAGTK